MRDVTAVASASILSCTGSVCLVLFTDLLLITIVLTEGKLHDILMIIASKFTKYTSLS